MDPRFSRYYTYIKPVFRNRIVKSYGPVVFSIITLTIFAIFAIRPTIGTIIGLQKSIKEQAQVLDQLKQKSQNLSEGTHNLQAMDPVIKDRIDALIPDQTSLASLINDLKSLTNNLDATISAMQFQTVDLIPPPDIFVKTPKLQEIDFTYNLQGNYPQFAELTRRIVSAKRLINIDSINIGHSGDSGLILSINAKAYYLKN